MKIGYLLKERMTATKVNDLTGRCTSQSDQTYTHLVLGSQIWGLKNGEFELGGQKFTLQGSCHPARQKPEKKQLTETALKYLNAPYHLVSIVRA